MGGGSTPPGDTKEHQSFWTRGPIGRGVRLKSGSTCWFESSRVHHGRCSSPVERQVEALRVVGSTPTPATNITSSGRPIGRAPGRNPEVVMHVLVRLQLTGPPPCRSPCRLRVGRSVVTRETEVRILPWGPGRCGRVVRQVAATHRTGVQILSAPPYFHADVAQQAEHRAFNPEVARSRLAVSTRPR